MTEMKERIYPELQPSAPIINNATDDRGHSYRLNIIREIQAFLEKEIKDRETLSKKYFRGAKIIHTVDNTLITVTIGAEGTGAILMATGVGAPFALFCLLPVSLPVRYP